MPFTPVHFGLGALPGGYSSRWFSFRTFCFANVVIDLEALYRIPLNLYPYHHWLHTFLLGTLVPLALLFPIGKPFCLWVSRVWNWIATRSASFRSLQIPDTIHALPAIIGVLIGSLSHVFFDSIMHGDIQPLMPFSDANPFRGLLTVSTLHVVLLVMLAIGFALFCLRVHSRNR